MDSNSAERGSIVMIKNNILKKYREVSYSACLFDESCMLLYIWRRAGEVSGEL